MSGLEYFTIQICVFIIFLSYIVRSYQFFIWISHISLYQIFDANMFRYSFDTNIFEHIFAAKSFLHSGQANKFWVKLNRY